MTYLACQSFSGFHCTPTNFLEFIAYPPTRILGTAKADGGEATVFLVEWIAQWLNTSRECVSSYGLSMVGMLYFGLKKSSQLYCPDVFRLAIMWIHRVILIIKKCLLFGKRLGIKNISRIIKWGVGIFWVFCRKSLTSKIRSIRFSDWGEGWRVSFSDWGGGAGVFSGEIKKSMLCTHPRFIIVK